MSYFDNFSSFDNFSNFEKVRLYRQACAQINRGLRTHTPESLHVAQINLNWIGRYFGFKIKEKVREQLNAETVLY